MSHVCTERIINTYKVSELVANEFPLKQGDIQSRRKKQVDAATLAKRWGIQLDCPSVRRWDLVGMTP